MVRITAVSTMALVGLAGFWLGLGGCGGENELPTYAVAPIGIPPDACGDAVPEVDSQWRQSHVVCGITSTLEAIAKRVPCAPDDPQECWKPCGPSGIGFKKLSCRGGAYAEDSMCDFDPTMDYGCYKIPEPEDVHPDCPTEVASAPRHNKPCSLPPCVVCGGNTYEQTTGYRNSSEGLLKQGYCTCNIATSPPKWKCATQGVAWPCPNGCGCN